MNKFLMILGFAGGIGSNIILTASMILAMPTNSVLLVFPFREWIVEIPLTLFFNILLIAAFWSYIKSIDSR